MALPTVREIWRLALPSASRLISGQSGITEPAVWARRMASHPPAFASLEQGDVALLSVEAIALLDERLSLALVVQSLGEGGAAAVGVVGEIGSTASEIADTNGLPLFLLPADADLRDIERDIIRLIVEREAQIDRRGRQVYRQLAQHSIENRGLLGIAEGLLQITGKPVVIQDNRLSVHALAWPEKYSVSQEEVTPSLKDDTTLRRWLRGQQLDGRAPPCVELSLPDASFSRCVGAIVIEGTLAGYVSLFGPREGLDELDLLSAERGALVCAAEMAKQRAVQAAEDRLRGDFLDLLLTTGPAEERALIRRAEEMDYELGRYHVVLVFGLGSDSARTLTLLASDFRARLLNTGIRMFLGPHRDGLVALCHASETSCLKQLEKLARITRDAVVRTTPQARISVGIGRPSLGLEGLRRSFSQAREALRLAGQLFDEDRVLAFSDMGVYRLLCHLQGSEELNGFYEQTLAPLARYDASRNAELVQTLETFFNQHGNVSQTAKTLYLHRNSLLYRLERISDITGMDLDDPDDRFSLQLALKVRAIVTGRFR